MSWETMSRHASREAAVAAVEALPVVLPKVGDLVRYAEPWNEYVHLSDQTFIVKGIVENYDFREFARSMGNDDLEPLYVTRYWLVDATRPNDEGRMCWPSAGDPEHPVRFSIVEEAPPAELDLLEMLGPEWAVER